jgi:ABC-2 type transport system ATP-binding protein
MPTVVRTDRLTKDFLTGFWRRRSHRALDELSLEIAPGEVFGLLGPNGAGKSTTLKLLNNLIWPTSGRAELFGLPVGDVRARARLGFLPEHPTFYDHLTAEELLLYLAGLFGYAPADRRARAARLLDLVGLSAEDRRRPLRQYSKGMVQRVGLAQALINDPELVILDEPMSGLDPLGRREVREIMLRLRDEGRTLLFSSHILSDAELLCSRVAILSQGRLAAIGTVEELTTKTAGAAAGRRGWEIVAAGVSPQAAQALQIQARKLTTIAPGRYQIELGDETRPEAVVAALAAQGAALVSVSPLRATLEEVFVQQISGTGGRPA